MSEQPFDIQQAHRWFAVELNNLAWDLIEADSRSENDLERMIHAAHASCFHWMEAGNLLNHLRAECLVASAYVTANQPEAALRHALRCLALSEQTAAEQTPFDRATTLGCAAHAFARAGRLPEAESHYRLALEAAAGFDHPDERTVFEKLYPPI